MTLKKTDGSSVRSPESAERRTNEQPNEQPNAKANTGKHRRAKPVLLSGDNIRERLERLSPSQRQLWNTAVMEVVSLIVTQSPGDLSVGQATTGETGK